MKRLVFLFLFGLFLFLVFNLKCITEKKSVFLSIRIRRGESVYGVLKRLESKGILENPEFLYFVLRLKGTVIKEGCYRIKGFMSVLGVIGELQKGTPCLKTVTIKEGYDVFDVDRVLSEARICEKGRVISLSGNATFLKSLDIPFLEGYIAPDTYRFGERTPCERAISHMVERRKRLLDDMFRSYSPPDLVARALGEVTAEKILVIASIVEKETGIKEEKRLISGVIYNRLLRHMKLQCDPTVIYAHKLAGRNIRKLRRKDLLIRSPYNTYLVRGLPPTPICNPSDSSIKSAMYPENTPFLYFVAGKNGHIFSKSYNQHLKNLRKLRRSWRKGS